MSTTALYHRLRTAGAAARDVLVRAAARRWRINVSDCRTEKGFVIDRHGDRLSYGELAGDAAKLPLNKAPPLKGRDRFRLIDTPAKSNGSAIYGIDVVVPGMLNAAIKTAPSFTGRVIGIKNEADILKMPGVHAAAGEHFGGREPAHATARQRDLRRRRLFLAGQARDRCARRGVRRRRERRSLHRKDRCDARCRARFRAGRRRRGERRSERYPEALRFVGDRAPVQAAAHRARSP
jgi:hypothetical protein